MFASTIKACRNSGSISVLKRHITKFVSIHNNYKYFSTTVSEEQYLKSPKGSINQKFSYNSITKPINVGSEEENQEFISVLPEIVNCFTDACKELPELQKACTKLLQENVGNGRHELGFFTVAAYKTFEAPENVSSANVRLANILGWCANLLVSANYIRDDIMEFSEMRYGKPCWYKRNNVGMQAINHANLMIATIYPILKKYFSELPCYLPIVEWFRDVNENIAIGHSLDHICVVNGESQLGSYTMSKFGNIAKLKTTYPVYLLPVKLGMYLAGKCDTELYNQTEMILSELGFFVTSQNNILDCYGDPAVTGKDPNDICKGKCTWLLVKTLEQATSEQKIILSEHYGNPGHESELKVRTLFNQLGILDEFVTYQQKSFDSVQQIIQQLPKDFNQEFFYKITDATYERKQ